MVAAKGNGFVFLKLRSPCGPVSYLFKINIRGIKRGIK